MATFIEDIKDSFSEELVASLRLVDEFWSAVRDPALQTMASAGELTGEIQLILRDFGLVTDDDLKALQAMAARWTGYGVNVQGEMPALALFFKGDTRGLRQLLPPSIQALNPEFVPWVRLRAIPPRGRRSAALMPGKGVLTATPGSPLVWTGVGCQNVTNDGTLGAFLDDGQGGTWILSANHVMSQNGACPNNQVDVPGLGIVSDRTCPVMICDNPCLNAVDAAVAPWSRGVSMSAGIPRLPPLGSIVAPRGGTVGLTATKAGASTALTNGLIAYLAEKITLMIFSFSDAEFEDQILILDQGQAFSTEGDSGSLVVLQQKDVSLPLGLLVFNGVPADEDARPIFSVVTPLENVFAALKGATGKSFSIIGSQT